MYFSRIRLRSDVFRTTQLARVLSDSSYSMHRLLWDLFPNEKRRNFLYREEIAREQLGTRAGVRGEPVYYVVSATKPISENIIFQVDTKDYQPKLQNGDRLSFELRANPVVTKKVDRKNSESFLKARQNRNVTNKTKLTKKRVRHDVAMDAQKSFLMSLCAELNLTHQLPSKPKKREYKKMLLGKGGLALDERLTALLKKDLRYSDHLCQSMQLHSKLEWSIKAVVDDALEKWMIRQGERNGFLLEKDDNDQYRLQNSAYRWHPLNANKGTNSGFSSVDFLGDLKVRDVVKFTEALFGGIGRAKAFGCGLLLVRRR